VLRKLVAAAAAAAAAASASSSTAAIDENGGQSAAAAAYPSPELAHALAGTFVNLVADPPLRESFLRGCGGPALCARLLARAAEERDWPLATLVGQLLWNALAESGGGGGGGAVAAAAEDTVADLAEALEELDI